MKSRKRQLITILIGGLVVGVLGARVWREYPQVLGAQVGAVGDLIITHLDAPLSGPIFDVEGMMPGDCEARTVEAENGGTVDKSVVVKSFNEEDSGNLQDVLSMIISVDGSPVYGEGSSTGSKTVADFFDDSDVVDQVGLGVVSSEGGTASYDFLVCFDEGAGNAYQSTWVKFDLKFKKLGGKDDEVCEVHKFGGWVRKKSKKCDDDGHGWPWWWNWWKRWRR